MNNIFRTIIFLIVQASMVGTVHAQQGFGTNTPAASSVVDMTATNKGVLLPRVALTAINSASPITAPATNLLVYNTATAGTAPNDVAPGFYYWNGTTWIRLLSKNDNLWSSTGNAGTTPGTNFVGTTDAQDLVFKTNATEQMRVTTAGSVGIGTTPNASAQLDVNSITKGFLPPRMTDTQIAAIVTPQEGLIVYNTTLHCLAYYANGAFTCVYNAPPARAGSSFTAFYNGWSGGTYSVGGASSTTVTHTAGETFSTNTTCTSKLISITGCGVATTVTGASGNVYALKEINGQCWIAENMREVPSAYSGYTPTSWLATSPGDQGYWGYYNTSTPNGSAGWGTVEPTNANGHEGMLYQWSAAMNGATTERSRGVCPSGFHVPSDCEWMYLEHGLGMKVSDQILNNTWRGQLSTEAVGIKLTIRSTGSSNASGFSGLFTGARWASGACSFSGIGAYYWSSTKVSASNAMYRETQNNVTVTGIYLSPFSLSNALSVRCLKD